MNGFLYDIKRTLTGKFTIILIILLSLGVILSAFVAGALAVSTQSNHSLILQPGVLLQDELSVFFGILLIPIFGIFSAYFYYSKDEVSGVMESIIARPITKGKLFISRFIGNSVSYLIALLISLLLADVILFKYTGVFISGGTFMAILIGYLIEAIAFSGIIYLITVFTRSQGIVLGSGIALLFVLGFMWTTITTLILFISKVNISSILFYKYLVILDSISPAYFPDLVADLHLGLYSSYNTSLLGINIFSVTIIGFVWVLVPAGIALFFARRRD